MRKIIVFFTMFVILMLYCSVINASDHEEAAKKLVEVLELNYKLKQAFEDQFISIFKKYPYMRELKPLMTKFLEKKLNIEVLMKEVIIAFKNEFSEKELQEITQFYSTSSGKKFISKLPIIESKILGRWVAKLDNHKEELHEMLRKWIKKTADKNEEKSVKSETNNGPLKRREITKKSTDTPPKSDPEYIKKEPKRIKETPPQYPVAAYENGVEGRVEMNVLTDLNGKVISCKIIKGAHPLLDKAAIEAVKQWEYEPFVERGIRRALTFTVIVNFTIPR